MASLIEDYALLSNMRSSALVSRTGSMDWWCAPRFDSPAVFSALLGTPDHGRWLLAPAEAVGMATQAHDAAPSPSSHPAPSVRETCESELPESVQVQRFYAENTFVLHTVWNTHSGSVRVTDFMPLTSRTEIVRRVEGLTGEVQMYQDVRLRFNFGSSVPWLTHFDLEAAEEGEHPESVLVGMAGPNAVVLRGDPLPSVAEDPDSRRHEDTFSVAAGQTRDFVLTWFPSYGVPPEAIDVNETLTATLNLWQDWSDLYDPLATEASIAQHTARDREPTQAERDARITATQEERADMVRRSLLVIRGLMHQATGGMIASASMSLPETIGGERNWDHRLTWARQVALALEVMLDHGHDREAVQLRNWLLRALASDVEHPNNVYTLDGSVDSAEHMLDLPGYERSRPVREGNPSGKHFQADVAGYVLTVFERLRRRGVGEDHLSWPLQQAMLKAVVANFEQKDQGVWEMRGEPQFYTHSRVMMWAALQSGVDAVRIHGLPGEVEVWENHRDQLAHEIWTHGYHAEAGSFVQYYGTTDVDASLLQLPRMGFVAYDDPRMLSTVERIRKELSDRSGMLVRYRNLPSLDLTADEEEAYASSLGVDGFPGQAPASLAATLQLVDQLARSGEVAEAVRLMDVVLSAGNDVGLLPTLYSAREHRMTGNFPQADSHLYLIRALDTLDVVQGRVGVAS